MFLELSKNVLKEIIYLQNLNLSIVIYLTASNSQTLLWNIKINNLTYQQNHRWSKKQKFNIMLNTRERWKIWIKYNFFCCDIIAKLSTIKKNSLYNRNKKKRAEDAPHADRMGNKTHEMRNEEDFFFFRTKFT